jgi:hypothetical protein
MRGFCRICGVRLRRSSVSSSEVSRDPDRANQVPAVFAFPFVLQPPLRLKRRIGFRVLLPVLFRDWSSASAGLSYMKHGQPLRSSSSGGRLRAGRVLVHGRQRDRLSFHARLFSGVGFGLVTHAGLSFSTKSAMSWKTAWSMISALGHPPLSSVWILRHARRPGAGLPEVPQPGKARLQGLPLSADSRKGLCRAAPPAQPFF